MPTSMNGWSATGATEPAVAVVSRCLVVDDHPAIRLGLRDLLAADPALEVVAACATAEEGLSYALRHPVDVAIVDYQLGGRTGLWLSRRLARLPLPPGVLVYSAYCNHLLAAACIVAQAKTLVSKAALGEVLVARVRAVADHRARLPIVPPALSDSIGRRFDHTEQAIFGLMSSAATPAEVSETLRLSPEEVDERLGRMLDALAPPPNGVLG